MKKKLPWVRFIFIIFLVALFFLSSGCGNRENFDGQVSGSGKDSFSYVISGNVKYRVKAEGNYFYFYDKGKWNKKFLKGVDIGTTKPGLNPGDLSISYEDYYRWFTEISAMGADCIRVYTAQRPQFYNAFADFNKKSKNPLYLFQGVWINENDITSIGDAYAQNGKIMDDFIQDAKNLADIIHGDITLPLRAGYASGTYTVDVSKYFAGWILGIEWDPNFVKITNNNNPAKNSYDGKYFYTQSASPFEAFLCQVGDELIRYQTEKYKDQVPLAFTNWFTTDPLTHPNEPHPDDDMVSVNMEDIKSRDSFLPNEFASYNVYPYYPDSFNYQRDYINYIDSSGKKNPYEAYLKDLKMAHTMPVIIGEFGIPTSRGKAHENVVTGYNQGNISETEQGDMILNMMNSIYKEKYAGGLIFSWQDEWFKKTWNTDQFDVAGNRPLWSNIQNNEQSFGILAFDPGEKTTICCVDADIKDWTKDAPVLTNSTGQLYMKSDERYVYFMAKIPDFDFNASTLVIPMDTIPGQGNIRMNDLNINFDRGADFVIVVNGKNNTRIMVDSYYDSFNYLYAEQYQMLPVIADIAAKNSGRFDQLKQCIGYPMTVPPENTQVPFESYETGKLIFGDGNPSHEDYQSLADFNYKDGILEIRIPWALLNVMDPSEKQIMNDLYQMQSISPTKADGFSVGMGVTGSAGMKVSLDGKFDWNAWTTPTFHERLKPVYYLLQKGLVKFQ